MKNIYYFNVDYRCNNGCVFCFSHNTCEHNCSDIELKSIKKMIKDYKIAPGDRIIINGGEPTIRDDIVTILEIFHAKGAEVVLYSNGRNLKHLELAQQVFAYVSRVVIPIHGDRVTHDEITQKDGAFDDTLRAFNNISKLGMLSKLEVKFIVNQKMIESAFNIADFLMLNGMNEVDVVITGMVSTKIALTNAYIIPNEEDQGKYVSEQLNQLMDGIRHVKIMDCKFCFFSEEMRNRIMDLESYVGDTCYKYYFFDSNVPNGKRLKYNGQRACINCKYAEVCRSILDACIVLLIDGNKKTLTLE